MNVLDVMLSVKVLFVLWVICVAVLYIKSDREYKFSYKMKYYDRLPGNYSPAEMRLLVNYGKLYPRDIVAEIIYLIIKGALDIEYTIKKDNSKEFMLVCAEDYKERLPRHEAFLVSWVASFLGNGRVVNISRLLSFSFNPDILSDFKRQFERWNDEVLQSEEYKKFFKPKTNGRIFGFLIGWIFLLLSVILAVYYKRPVYFVFIIPSVLTFIYAYNIIKRTVYGQQQYELWMAFKRYLHDIGVIKEPLTSAAAEGYLPYAVALGVYKQLIDVIERKAGTDAEGIRLLNKLTPQELKSLLDSASLIMEKSIITAV